MRESAERMTEEEGEEEAEEERDEGEDVWCSLPPPPLTGLDGAPCMPLGAFQPLLLANSAAWLGPPLPLLP